jgi:hypothetical protein
MKDGELVVAIELEVAVVRCRELGDDDLDAGAVGGHPRTRQQLLPMQTINTGEPIGGALDERNERAHGERDATLGEIATNAIERSEQLELLVREPREPLARDLGALVGGLAASEVSCAHRTHGSGRCSDERRDGAGAP